jgi:hypothetical protein
MCERASYVSLQAGYFKQCNVRLKGRNIVRNGYWLCKYMYVPQETVKQIDQLSAQNIIERSDASYYSQVLLTAKPDGTKRFCIDYRKLNDYTKPAFWPLLNIKQMFVRLGTHKSSIYSVVDLTSGYHQAPLSLAARIFTVFITFCGVFHYLRLPFGPKRAPSYCSSRSSIFHMRDIPRRLHNPCC